MKSRLIAALPERTTLAPAASPHELLDVRERLRRQQKMRIPTAALFRPPKRKALPKTLPANGPRVEKVKSEAE